MMHSQNASRGIVAGLIVVGIFWVLFGVAVWWMWRG